MTAVALRIITYGLNKHKMADTPEVYFIAHYTSHKCIYVSTYIHVYACIYV